VAISTVPSFFFWLVLRKWKYNKNVCELCFRSSEVGFRCCFIVLKETSLIKGSCFFVLVDWVLMVLIIDWVKLMKGPTYNWHWCLKLKICNRSSYITLRDLIMVKQDAVFKSQKLLIVHREVITGCYLKKQGWFREILA
jgi:hypothetical protein